MAQTLIINSDYKRSLLAGLDPVEPRRPPQEQHHQDDHEEADARAQAAGAHRSA